MCDVRARATCVRVRACACVRASVCSVIRCSVLCVYAASGLLHVVRL
jgi:hypothetical protein